MAAVPRILPSTPIICTAAQHSSPTKLCDLSVGALLRVRRAVRRKRKAGGGGRSRHTVSNSSCKNDKKCCQPPSPPPAYYDYYKFGNHHHTSHIHSPYTRQLYASHLLLSLVLPLSPRIHHCSDRDPTYSINFSRRSSQRKNLAAVPPPHVDTCTKSAPALWLRI
jgi:hypothetical protein